MEISTSILTVEKENATKIFYDLEVAKTDYYHIDVMDGKFVEKNTEELMYEYANTIKQISNVPLDVHLMVENVKENVEFLPSLNMVLIMTVEPGKGGQKLIPETVEKVRNLKKYIEDNKLETYIEVDGGVNK